MRDVRGDRATWHEEDDPPVGTINTLLFVNWPLTPGAMARAVVTMTEGKSAALRDLAVASRYSRDLATGTGTDQYGIATPLDSTRKPKTSAGHHAKLGELIGKAVRQATLEGLRWQNGLEPSHTRSIVHALKRFGMREECLLAAMVKRLSADDFALLQKNFKSVVYEPCVAASAYAFAAVLGSRALWHVVAGVGRSGVASASCHFGDRTGRQTRSLFVMLRATADK